MHRTIAAIELITRDQQTSTPGTVQILIPSESSLRLQALLEQQTSLVKTLVNAETQLKAFESVPASGNMTLYETRLEAQRAFVAQTRAKLNATRAEIDAIRATATTPTLAAAEIDVAPQVAPPVAVQIEPPPLFIFGLTVQEAKFAGGFLLLFPLVVAFAIRIMKRGISNPQAPIPPDRFARLETAMETIAVEVERLGESQRFTSKLLNEAQPKQQPSTVKPSYDRLMRTPV